MTERLQKLIARSGLCSRRAAEELLAAGRVRVNGEVAALGDRADPACDRIEVDGISLRSTNKVPLDLLKEQTQVEVYRTSVQPSLTIRTAVGLALNNYTFDGRTISASLSGPAQGSLELTADGPVAVELNGFRRLHMPDEEGNIRIPVELPQGIPSIYFTATRSAE